MVVKTFLKKLKIRKVGVAGSHSRTHSGSWPADGPALAADFWDQTTSALRGYGVLKGLTLIHNLIPPSKHIQLLNVYDF